MSDLSTSPERLDASRDPVTGDIFVPARWLAADGSLRRCQPHTLAAVGRLHSWTRMGRRYFGQIDLAQGPRIQVTLLGEAHDVGADYAQRTLETEDGMVRRGFARV